VRPWLERRNVELVFVSSAEDCGDMEYCSGHADWGGAAPGALMRYRHYLTYIKSHPGYDVVLWSDFRDAVFQRDPFELWTGGSELLVFGEHPGRPLTADGNPAVSSAESSEPVEVVFPRRASRKC
jgi:hypothetical protein